MTIRILHRCGDWTPGDTPDVDDIRARKLIASGYAEALDGAAVPIESAMDVAAPVRPRGRQGRAKESR